MKVWIDSDEWYPVFTVDNGERAATYNLNPWGQEAEVTEEQYAEWVRVFEEFDKVQTELRAAIGAEK